MSSEEDKQMSIEEAKELDSEIIVYSGDDEEEESDFRKSLHFSK